MKMFTGHLFIAHKKHFLEPFLKVCVFITKQILCFLWPKSMVVNHGFYASKRYLIRTENVSCNVPADIESTCPQKEKKGLREFMQCIFFFFTQRQEQIVTIWRIITNYTGFKSNALWNYHCCKGKIQIVKYTEKLTIEN